jgi:hypothetical protein
MRSGRLTQEKMLADQTETSGPQLGAGGSDSLKAAGTTVTMKWSRRPSGRTELGPVSHNEYPPVAQGGLNPSEELRKRLVREHQAGALASRIAAQDINQISTLEPTTRFSLRCGCLTRPLLQRRSPLQSSVTLDQISVENFTAAEHGFTSANKSEAQALEELSGAIRTSDQCYIDY